MPNKKANRKVNIGTKASPALSGEKDINKKKAVIEPQITAPIILK